MPGGGPFRMAGLEEAHASSAATNNVLSTSAIFAHNPGEDQSADYDAAAWGRPVPVKLLIVNPNTSGPVTDVIAREAARAAWDRVDHSHCSIWCLVYRDRAEL